MKRGEGRGKRDSANTQLQRQIHNYKEIQRDEVRKGATLWECLACAVMRMEEVGGSDGEYSGGRRRWNKLGADVSTLGAD